MKKKVTVLWFLLVLFLTLDGQPTDNPVKTHYGNGNYPVWTNQINWTRVIDMSTYTNGDNDFEKFENARDEVYTAGGGVLYYPGGEYDFSDMPASGKDGRGMMLKEGVVIRGETPSNTSAEDGDLPLTTRFIFPTKLKEGEFLVPEDWAFIGILPDATSGNLRDVNNVGIVWVEIEYGTIYFGYDGTWGDDYVTASAWKSGKVLPDWQARVPDGTFPYDPFCGSPMGGNDYLGAGSGRLVFGCQLVNSTVTNDVFFEGYPSGYTGYFNYKFGARICIYASDIFVANNSLPKPTASFQYRQVTKSEDEKIIQFDYGLTHGLDINKNYLNIYTNKTTGYTQNNVIIRDNNVWNHGRNGYALSGEYMIVKNNRNPRSPLFAGDDRYGLGGNDWVLTLDGWIETLNGGSGSVSDNLSRGYDMAGKNSWMDSNTFNNTNSYPGNDGEGILWQAHGGMSILPSFVFSNNSGSHYTAGYDISSIGVLWIWNKSSAVGNHHKTGNTYCNAVAVENTASIKAEDYFITECPTTSPAAPTDVQIELTEDSSYILITWEDVADNEIGYRIDRSIGGTNNWETLVYRPSMGDSTSSCPEHNLPLWRDYTYPKEIDTYYRVVTIDCNDDDAGASPAEGPVHVIITSSNTTPTVPVTTGDIYPNPVSNILTIHIPQTVSNNTHLSIFSPDGMQVYQSILQSSQQEVNVSQFIPGIYILTIRGVDVNITKKFIVE
jgi:hypothetical protein